MGQSSDGGGRRLVDKRRQGLGGLLRGLGHASPVAGENLAQGEQLLAALGLVAGGHVAGQLGQCTLEDP